MSINRLRTPCVMPPKTGATYSVLVPAIDQDGIDLGGVRVPTVAAPLGTMMGWNLYKNDIAEGELCSLTGGFIAFANSTKTPGDSRPSLEERYGDKNGYVAAVMTGAAELVKNKLMLAEDVGYVIDLAKTNAAVFDQK